MIKPAKLCTPMMASPTTAADADDDSDDFVVQTITAHDGSVQDPKSMLTFTSEQKSAGFNDYGDVDSSSSDSSSDSEEYTQHTPTINHPPAARDDKMAKQETPKKRKRVRFANDASAQDPPAEVHGVKVAEQIKETAGDGLDEEMAAFEAEVRVLDGGRDEADVDLAEIEDEREKALEDDLRTRVINMRKRLRGSESKESPEAAAALTSENLRLLQREKTSKQDDEYAVADEDDDDDDDIDLMADWTEISGRGKNGITPK